MLQETMESAKERLRAISEDECFSEVYNILNSLMSQSLELYTQASEKLGLKVGNSGNIIIDNSNAIEIAALALVFSSLADDGKEYPIFFNHQRENMTIYHLVDDLYVLTGVECLASPTDEVLVQFYSTLRRIGDRYIIEAESIVTILEKYIEIGDIGIALSDYYYSVRNNKSLMSDFSITKTNIISAEVNKNTKNVLESMFYSGRLDMSSLNILKSGLQERK